jgi:hypothetical protein
VSLKSTAIDVSPESSHWASDYRSQVDHTCSFTSNGDEIVNVCAAVDFVHGDIADVKTTLSFACAAPSIASLPAPPSATSLSAPPFVLPALSLKRHCRHHQDDVVVTPPVRNIVAMKP